MFGKLLGEIVSAPIKVVNVPVKLAGKAADAVLGEEDCLGGDNCLDDAAEAVQETVEDTFDRD